MPGPFQRGGSGTVRGRIPRREFPAFAMRGRLAIVAGICLAATLLCGAPPPEAPGSNPIEGKSSRISIEEVKSAIIITLSRLVTWPEASLGSTNAPFRIGILGNDPLGDPLRRLAAGTTMQGRKLLLVHAQRPDDLTGCQVVFVSPDRDLSLRDSLAPLLRHPILVLGDEPGFAKHGGMVNLRPRDDLHVSLEICREAIEARGLGIKASLRQIKGIEWISIREKP